MFLQEMKIIELAYDHFKDSQQIILAPNIEEKKLQNAMESYAGNIDKSSIIFFYDDTVRGSGKEGLIGTLKGLHWKPSKKDDPKKFITYSEIEKFVKKYLVININEDVEIHSNLPGSDAKKLNGFILAVKKLFAEEDTSEAGLAGDAMPTSPITLADGYKKILNEIKIRQIVDSCDHTDYSAEHLKHVIGKKKERSSNFMEYAVFLLIGAIFLFVFSFVVWTAIRSIIWTASSLMLIAVIFFFIWGIYARATASKIKLSESLKDVCEGFYKDAFAFASDITAADIKVYKLYPYVAKPVWQLFEKTGWRIIESTCGTDKKGIAPMECTICGKKGDYYRPDDEMVLISNFPEVNKESADEKTRHEIESYFVRCENCNSIFCYECIAYGKPENGRYLCPSCGLTNNSLDGLDFRWRHVRLNAINSNISFNIDDISIEEHPSNDRRILNIAVHIRCKPSGKLTFKNLALHIDGHWFLATPEPVLIASS